MLGGFIMDFSSVLKMLREQKGVTQEKLSEALHISTTAISHYEKGSRQPGLETIKNIAEYFDVSVDYLMGLTSYNIAPSKINRKYTKDTTFDSIINRLYTLDTAHRQLLVSMINCMEAEMVLSSKRK